MFLFIRLLFSDILLLVKLLFLSFLQLLVVNIVSRFLLIIAFIIDNIYNKKKRITISIFRKDKNKFNCCQILINKFDYIN